MKEDVGKIMLCDTSNHKFNKEDVMIVSTRDSSFIDKTKWFNRVVEYRYWLMITLRDAIYIEACYIEEEDRDFDYGKL
jgi:hypothetical protein